MSIGGVNYTLDDVRKFVLLYDSNPGTAPSLQNTASALGNVGTKKVWTKDSNTFGPGAYYGWETTEGTLKDGQFKPTFNTGNVFSLTTALSNANDSGKKLVGFGFDISVLVGNRQVDPFGNNCSSGSHSDGFVFVANAIPEPAFYQMGALLTLSSGSLLFRLRRKPAG